MQGGEHLGYTGFDISMQWRGEILLRFFFSLPGHFRRVKDTASAPGSSKRQCEVIEQECFR